MTAGRRTAVPPFAGRTLASTLVALALLGSVATGQHDVTVYRGATVWPGDGPPIPRAVLIVAQGKVQAIGAESTAAPDGAEIKDVSGHTIKPGLIDAAWTGGIAGSDANEQSSVVTPALHVLDNLDPQDPSFARARSGGVTTVHLMPGTHNVIGGMSSVLKTWATDPAAMVVRDEAALRIVLGAEPSLGNMPIGGGEADSMYYRRPTTRMGVIWAIRRSFYDAQEHLAESLDRRQATTSDQRGLDVLARVLQGKLPVVTTARSEQDLRTALRLAAEFGYTPILDEAQDAYLVADELKQARVWVTVGAPSADRVAGTASMDGAEPRFGTVAALQRAAVPFVIATGTNPLALDLMREAMFARRFGRSAEQALAAVTAQPARMLGIDDRTGNLAAGKDADFVVWSVDPFDPASLPLTVVVDGHETSVLR